MTLLILFKLLFLILPVISQHVGRLSKYQLPGHTRSRGPSKNKGNWWEQKNFDQPKNLTQSEYTTLAKASRFRNFDWFLNPILIPRVAGTSQNAEVKEHIVKQLESLGWSVETDKFKDSTPIGTKSFENIMATLDKNAKRRLVLACHFDSKLFKNVDFYVATDSAVSCAIMLYLAYILQKPLNAHKAGGHNVTLQLLFFDGEEAFVDWTDTDSLYGSRHLANLWVAKPFPPGNNDRTNELHRMDVFVLLDLLGTTDTHVPLQFPRTERTYNLLEDAERTLRKGQGTWAGSTQSPEIFTANRKSPPRGIQDDHIPFMKNGVNIVHLISDPFPKVWHDPKDDKTAVDANMVANLNSIFRVFVTRYLHLTNLNQLNSKY